MTQNSLTVTAVCVRVEVAGSLRPLRLPLPVFPAVGVAGRVPLSRAPGSDRWLLLASRGDRVRGNATLLFSRTLWTGASERLCQGLILSSAGFARHWEGVGAAAFQKLLCGH